MGVVSCMGVLLHVVQCISRAEGGDSRELQDWSNSWSSSGSMGRPGEFGCRKFMCIVCACVRVCVHACVCIIVCVYMHYVYACVCTYVYIHTYMHYYYTYMCVMCCVHVCIIVGQTCVTISYSAQHTL